MHLFRKLAGNIFFKIILAFIMLSFVLFGVNGFILNDSGSWVAKIGGKTISQNVFMKEMQKNREMILQANKGEEAMKYLESEQFKSDTLGRMINAIVIEKLRADLGVEASKKLILQEVAKDANFRDKDGKFDRAAFKAFLAKNGLDEEKYVRMVQDEVVATMVIQTMSMNAPVNTNVITQSEEFKKEQRFADVVIISDKNAGKPEAAKPEEITAFFEANRTRYSAPETRKVSYLSFSRKDFAKDFQVSDSEVAAEYDKNREQFQRPESRNLYHVVFETEDSAKDFAKKLSANSDKEKAAAEFAKLAKEIQKKDQKAITLSKVTQKDLIPELSSAVFKLAVNDHSEVLKSPLGYHVFLLTNINKSEVIPLIEVRESIKAKMLAEGKDKAVQAKISQIDDEILTSNSLSEVAKKYSLKLSHNALQINQAGQDSKGNIPAEIKDLSGFAENAFSVKKDQASKLFFSKGSDEYYAVKVEEIAAAHEKKLEEVRSEVLADLTKHKTQAHLQMMAQKIGEEIQENPADAAKIAAKHGLKFEKNREFPRIFYVNFQGRQIPYANKFLDELFSLKIGQATSVHQQSAAEFMVGVLRSSKKPELGFAQIDRAKKESEGLLRNEILQGYNAFVMKKYPVKVNEKALGKKEEK
jgi:peptidyl-prolyl cis-trans isomerase D